MTEQSIVMIFIVVGIFAAAAGIMIRDKRKHRRWALQNLQRMWGSVATREYTSEELTSIYSYTKKHCANRFMVDDITWNDLNMEQVFILLNTTVSSCGEDVLYKMLRVPEFDQNVLDERNRVVEYFRTHEKERIQMQMTLRNVRKMSQMSIYDYIHVLKDVEQKGSSKYILMAILTIAAIISLFVQPVFGTFFLIAVISANISLRMKNTKKMEPYLNCMVCILRMLKAADGFAKIKNGNLQSYLDIIENSRNTLKKFRRGAYLVSATTSIQDGIETIFISYLKLLFNVDFIKFYSMLKQVTGHEKEIDDLFTAMGELDAMIAIASFREFLPYYCEPILKKRDGNEQISMEISDMYHPMIEYPVANSIIINGGVLVTGSNASGKSTFLKNIALNGILAQTIYTCTAHFYRAQFLKVMTSMALRDNLEGGESYYIVEIKSLQRILKEAEKEEALLCIVDEVLRGTNTIERIAASSRILQSLVVPHVLPLAATHDIELSYILEKSYKNYHFEEEIREKDVYFNYMLKSGRAVSRNAIKLLEMIGYDKSIIEEALEAAKDFEQTGEWRNIC